MTSRKEKGVLIFTISVPLSVKHLQRLNVQDFHDL